jgi:AraC-like DNA-binding protein
MCRLVVRQTTLDTALRAGLGCYHVMARDFEARLSIDENDCAHVRLTDRITDPLCRRQLHATFVFFLYGMMCWLTGRRLPLVGVSLFFPKGEYGNEIAKVYRTSISYSAPFTELRFDAELMNLPNVQDIRSGETFLRSCPGVLAVAFHDTKSMVERVRRYLRRSLVDGSSLEEVARNLQVSIATLRRRLLEGGTSFQKLKDEIRRDAAIDYLVNTRLPLEELATRVGFIEVSAFHRAFKRWTGCAPGDYRKRVPE